VAVALDVPAGRRLGVAVRVGVGVAVADGTIVDDAVGVGVMDENGDAVVVGEATIRSEPSGCATYRMYTIAARNGTSRRISRNFLTTPRLGRGTEDIRSQAVSRQSWDYSYSADLSSPSFFLPFSRPTETLILG